MKVIKNPNPPVQVRQSSPYCGRIDEHKAHPHHTHGPGKRRPLWCPGTPTIEGGARS